jgi:hypothetical protein
VIRALATLIVVCLVAATGARPVEAARDQRSALSAPHKVEKIHARAVHAAAPRRASAQAPELPAIVAVAALAFVPPAACPSGVLAEHRVWVVGAISTRSARGPPVV